MNHRIIKYFFVLIVFLFSQSIYAKPINLVCAQKALMAYYQDLKPESGFIQEVNSVVEDAKNYLEKRVEDNNRSPHPQKLAMVLDIDDTSLTNYPGIKKDGFADTKDQIERRYHEANAPALQPVLNLYNEAIAKNVSVFFITARVSFSNPPDDLRPYTISNLQKAGYVGYSGLYLPTKGDEHHFSSAEFKTKIRKMLTEQGYTIIVSLGDQDSDLVGGYAEHTGKIPNYLYTSSPCPQQFCAT